MTVLLTGSSGYLGTYLSKYIANRCTLHTAHYTHPPVCGHPVALNLADRDAVRQGIQALAPDVVIHTAAVNPGFGTADQMHAVNALGAGYVAEGAVQAGARLIHVSTDIVHSGRNAPYTDEAPPTPINDYGQSKADGEAAVRTHHPEATIVRTSLIYGIQTMDRGTAGFAQKLATGKPLKLFTDAIRQPIFLKTLSESLWRLTRIPYPGILNVAGRQALSRAAFGRKMLAYWQVEGRARVQPGRAAAISDRIPLDLRLNIARAEALLQMVLPGVDEVLARHETDPPARDTY